MVWRLASTTTESCSASAAVTASTARLHAGAYVIATAGPHSSRRVTAAGADEVIDHTTADVVAAVSRPGKASSQTSRM
jgi:NADPH:quinone reductase-like Zn-dependent oxidoreductase